MNSSPSVEAALIDAADTFRDSMEALYELITLVNESAEQLDNTKTSFERRLQLADPSVEDPGELYAAIDGAIEQALNAHHEALSADRGDGLKSEVEDGADADTAKPDEPVAIELDLTPVAT